MAVIWVTGSNGQVGQAIKRLIQKAPFPWIVRFFSHSEFNLTIYSTMKLWFEQERPTCIINLAAYTAVDRAESESNVAYAVNSEGVEHLAQLCSVYSVSLIHVSTDYVFAGTSSTPYDEDALVGATTVYGQSKAQGEANIRAELDAHIILRTSWVFSANTENFVSKVLLKGYSQRKIFVIADQFGCPTSADNLAIVLLGIVNKISEGKAVYGTYHYCDNKIYSWFSFAEHIFNLAGRYSSAMNSIEIIPVSTSAYRTAAKRPAYSVLKVEKLSRDYGLSSMPCTQALDNAVQQTIEQLEQIAN